MALVNNILDLIGETPTVPLRRMFSRPDISFYGKVEPANLTGSMKARSALGMIEAAEEREELRPGMTIIESTSGNLGLALAAIGSQKGYEVILVIDPKTDALKQAALEAYGAKLEMVQRPDSDGAYQPARMARRTELLEQISNSWTPNQYHNPDNMWAHYKSTGPEIWRDLGQRVDVLVGAVGTCGHLAGTARYLLEQNPNIRVLGVEPIGSNITGKGTYGPYLTSGPGLSFTPTNYDPELIHDVFQVSDQEAFATARELARKEAIFSGGSAGTVIAAMRRIQEDLDPGSRVIGILADDGWRYAANFYNDRWLADHGIRPGDV